MADMPSPTLDDKNRSKWDSDVKIPTNKDSISDAGMKREYLRIIAFWGAIFALVIMTYQLGQWNALSIIDHIHAFCGNNTIANVGILGDTIIQKNITTIFTALP